MSVTLTLKGESLMARLQAEGRALNIDTFLFAHVEGQDPTAPVSPSADIPENVVFRSSIPDEFKAFVNPNQVVYSTLLGSDIGDFEFNWQGLYCSEHDTLVAYSTLPTIKKRAYNPATNTAGNNLNRNFILSYSGIQELTNISISPKTWQLDFTIRHKGIDERERLSNRDIYHRSGFFDDGWKLEKEGAVYVLKKGVGYVEGIRCALDEDLPIAIPQTLPCDVYLDVCMEPEGSDVVTKVEPVFGTEGQELGDYTSPAPFTVHHYVEKVAHIDKEGKITDLRRIVRLIPQDGGKMGDSLLLGANGLEFKEIDTSNFVGKTLKIDTTSPLNGGGTLEKNLTLNVTTATDAQVQSRSGYGLVNATQLGLLGMNVFFSQTSGEFVVPEGITRLFIILTGGGGSGAFIITGSQFEASGGSGAGTAIGIFDVMASQKILFTIGAGGIAPIETTASDGMNGGASSCLGMTAFGGYGGTFARGNPYFAPGLPGGQATGGLLNLTGGSSSHGVNLTNDSGGINGSGGSSFWGGGGSGLHYGFVGIDFTVWTQKVVDGGTPGAGGGGKALNLPVPSFSTLNAGSGADGAILILY